MKRKITLFMTIFCIMLFCGCDKIDLRTEITNAVDELKETEAIKNVKDFINQKKMDISETVCKNIQDYITEKYNNFKSIDNINFDVDKHYTVTITDKDGNKQELRFDITGNGIEINTTQ